MPRLDQKGVAPIFLVVGLILILVVSLLIYVSVIPHDPSQSEWMNWKFEDTNSPSAGSGSNFSPIPQVTVVPHPDQKINTFTSTLFGYSISFPDHWKYQTQDESLNANDDVDLEKKDNLSMKVSAQTIGLSAPKESKGDFNYLHAMTAGSSYVDDVVHSKHTKIKNFSIDGYDGVAMTEYFTYEGQLYYMHYQIRLDAITTIFIDFQANTQATLDKNKKVIDQVINSVKIQPRPNASSELKTYENKKYGFSFKYPTHWAVSDFLNDQNMSEVILRDPEGIGRLSLSLMKGNYSDRCEDANLGESFFIGDQTVKLRDYCNKENFYLQSQDGTSFVLSTAVWGLLAEDTVKDVLKSLTGLKVIR